MYEIDAVFTGKKSGSLGVSWSAPRGRHCGGYTSKVIFDCAPHVWSCPGKLFLAHEIGHVAGLEHEDGTIMASCHKPGLEAEPWQVDQVQSWAAKLKRRCRN